MLLWLSKIIPSNKEGFIPIFIDFQELRTLSGTQYFSKMNLMSGYWQVELDPQAHEKTAFTTHAGYWVHYDAVWSLQCPKYVPVLNGMCFTRSHLADSTRLSWGCFGVFPHFRGTLKTPSPSIWSIQGSRSQTQAKQKPFWPIKSELLGSCDYTWWPASSHGPDRNAQLHLT